LESDQAIVIAPGRVVPPTCTTRTAQLPDSAGRHRRGLRGRWGGFIDPADSFYQVLSAKHPIAVFMIEISATTVPACDA
jgi:hypothetical protein